MPNQEITPTTIAEAKTYLRKGINQGVLCPCCTQYVKMYHRPITSAMACALILISRVTFGSYIHIETYLKSCDCPSSIRGDVTKLKYWGLIEPHPEYEGEYRITERGIDFVYGRTKVESHIKLFNNVFYGFKGNYVGIKECLKKKFNYDKLMKGEL